MNNKIIIWIPIIGFIYFIYYWSKFGGKKTDEMLYKAFYGSKLLFWINAIIDPFISVLIIKLLTSI